MTTPASPSMDLVPPGGLVPGVDALGAYHLLRPLGTGGMARVWLAVDGATGRKVAIKRMLPRVRYDEELRDLFVDEGKLGLRLRHPNIVETIEVGEAATVDGDEPYLVLELLQGRPLIEILRAAGRHKTPMPLAVVVRVVVEAARALEHAHKLAGDDGQPLGIVHRDVTPHNVFVCEDGTIKVVDFGIAKSADQSHKTKTGLIKGKLAYLAPEQIKGKDLDARADVFALGIVMWELLVGRPLFRGNNDAETLHRVVAHEVVAPELLRGDVPNGLSAIALRALQRDRDRRLPSASALADAIEAVAEASGISTSQQAVQAFVAELFPDDAGEHAEDRALAQRTFEHLSSSRLRAIGSNPWLTPIGGVPMAPRRRRPLVAALEVTLVASVAGLTMYAMRRSPTAIAASHERTLPARAELREPPAVVTPQAKPAPDPAPASDTRQDAKPALDARAKVTVAKHAVERGSLRIVATPWADVTLDGKALGTTPLRSASVGEGIHHVVLTNRDLGAFVRRRVVVRGGQEAVLVINLFTQKK